MNRTSLIEARKAIGYTQEDMAARLGISASHYSMIESGDRTPSLPLARKISQLLHMPIEQLFFDHELHEACDSTARDEQALAAAFRQPAPRRG